MLQGVVDKLRVVIVVDGVYWPTCAGCASTQCFDSYFSIPCVLCELSLQLSILQQHGCSFVSEAGLHNASEPEAT